MQSSKRAAGRRPKTGRREPDTRGEILAAARRVFARQGLNGAAVRAVAKAAKVNNAMIYYHFKDTDDLYRSVLTDSFSAMMDIWDDPIFKSEASVRSRIEHYIRSFIRFQRGNEELRRIMAMEFAASGGNVTWVCEKYFAENYLRLATLFKEGIRKGELKKIDPSLAVASLIGVVVHNFIMQPMAEQVYGKSVNLNPGKFGVFVTDLFFSGLSAKSKKSRQ